jgi:hypothetical protein
LSDIKKYLLGVLAALSCLSCSKSKDWVNEPAQKQVVAQGNIYNHCEVEPFYLLLDTMMTYTSTLPIDSLHSPNWLGYIHNVLNLMHEVYRDSANADIKIIYLQNSRLEYEILNAALTVEPVTLIVAGDTTDRYPYYGAIKIHRANQEILLFMLNRYIGGCLHDELIWQLSE